MLSHNCSMCFRPECLTPSTGPFAMVCSCKPVLSSTVWSPWLSIPALCIFGTDPNLKFHRKSKCKSKKSEFLGATLAEVCRTWAPNRQVHFSQGLPIWSNPSAPEATQAMTKHLWSSTLSRLRYHTENWRFLNIIAKYLQITIPNEPLLRLRLGPDFGKTHRRFATFDSKMHQPSNPLIMMTMTMINDDEDDDEKIMRMRRWGGWGWDGGYGCSYLPWCHRNKSCSLTLCSNPWQHALLYSLKLRNHTVK